LRKGSVGGFVRDVFGAGEKAEEGAALEGDVIADGAAEHGVGGLESVEGGTKSDRALHVEGDFAADVGEGAKVRGKYDADHHRGRFSFEDLRDEAMMVTPVEAGATVEKTAGLADSPWPI
jgi:hypothetical protein